MQIMQEIKNFMNRLVGSGKETVNRFFMSQEIEIVKKGLNGILETLGLFEKDNTLRLNITNFLKQDKVYQLYLKTLHGRAAQEEHKVPLAGFKALVILTIKELEDLSTYLEGHPEVEKASQLDELKYSQATLLGIIEVGVNIERFGTAFLFKILNISGGYEGNSFNPIKANKMFTLSYPWFAKEIDDNLMYITGLINRYCNFKSMGLIDRILNTFKSQNYDPVLINEGKANDDFIPMLTDDTMVSECAALGLRALNPFRWLGQRKVLKDHERALRQEYEIGWMKNQITLIQYQQSGMNPEEPRYKEQQKIIDHYAELIAKISAEVDKYRKG